MQDRVEATSKMCMAKELMRSSGLLCCSCFTGTMLAAATAIVMATKSMAPCCNVHTANMSAWLGSYPKGRQDVALE